MEWEHAGMASVPVSCQELAVVEQESEGKGRYPHPAGPCRVTVHAGVGISAAVLLGIWVKKGLRCGELEKSVVPCYFDGYLWETYNIRFLSALSLCL